MPSPLENSGENSRIADNAADVGLGDSLHNEWQVLTSGLKEAPAEFASSAKQAWDHKKSSALEVGISFAAGLGLGMYAKRAGAVGLIARGLGAAAGLSFIYDGIKPWKQAWDKAWHAKNKSELDAASHELSRQVGRFTFDAALMTPGAIGGTLAGQRVSLAMSEGTLKLPKMDLILGGETKAGAEASTVVDGAQPGKIVEGVKAEAAGAEALPATEGVAETTPPARYKFVQLDPSSRINVKFDYGVEVTDPRLLKGQPNLDHHGPGATSETPSAAEQALALPADKMPKPGSILATIRPDTDSITAMAVLANRLEGRPVAEALVREIGRLDRGLPPSELYADRTMRDKIDAIRRKSRAPDPLHKKVFLVKDILDDSVNMDYVRHLAERQRMTARDVHERLDRELVPETVVPDKVVFVKSDNRMAMGHGYRYAPVVILEQENAHFRRFSVGVHDGSPLDKYFPRAIKELQSIEPGWGGRSSIFGSPQDRDTALSAQQVIDVVKRYVDPPAYKRYLWNTTDFLKQSRPFKWFFHD